MSRIQKLTNARIEYIGNLKLTKKNRSIPNYEVSKNVTIMIASTHNKEDKLIIPHLKVISETIEAQKIIMTDEEAVIQYKKTKGFIEKHGREPKLNSNDPI